MGLQTERVENGGGGEGVITRSQGRIFWGPLPPCACPPNRKWKKNCTNTHVKKICKNSNTFEAVNPVYMNTSLCVQGLMCSKPHENLRWQIMTLELCAKNMQIMDIMFQYQAYAHFFAPDFARIIMQSCEPFFPLHFWSAANKKIKNYFK